MEEKRLQEILQEIAGRTEESYPCTPTPGIKFAPDGRISEVISKAGQIRIKERAESVGDLGAHLLSELHESRTVLYLLSDD